MKRITRGAVAGVCALAISMVSPLASSRPAEAGFAPESIAFSLFDGEWSQWVSLGDLPVVDLTNVTAVIVAFPVAIVPDPDCIDLQTPVGSKQDFRFVLDANACLTVEELGTTSALPIAQFIWGQVDDDGVTSLLRCIDAVGVSSTEGSFETRLQFSDLSLQGSASASVDDVLSSMLAQVPDLRNSTFRSTEARARLRGVPYVPFRLEIEAQDAPPPESITPDDGIWTIDVSLERCLGDIDESLLEYYQRQAELIGASTLPDTL